MLTTEESLSAYTFNKYTIKHRFCAYGGIHFYAVCLIVCSCTQPVEEIIQDGENGILVDMFKTDYISRWVIDVLTDLHAYDALRHNSRQTIVENYDLKTIFLRAQFRLLELAARGHMR